MSKITNIECQKKHPYRMNIFIDNEYYMQVAQEVVYSFGLKEGQEVDEERLKEIADKDAYLRGKEQALRLLKYRGRTEKELRERLNQKGFAQDIIRQIIEFLKEYDFINDEYLARQMLEEQRQKYGRNRIWQKLSSKGISHELIEKVMADLDDEEEYRKALHLAEKRAKEIRDEEPQKIYGKLGRHLVQKGYDYEIITKVLNQVLR